MSQVGAGGSPLLRLRNSSNFSIPNSGNLFLTENSKPTANFFQTDNFFPTATSSKQKIFSNQRENISDKTQKRSKRQSNSLVNITPYNLRSSDFPRTQNLQAPRSPSVHSQTRDLGFSSSASNQALFITFTRKVFKTSTLVH